MKTISNPYWKYTLEIWGRNSFLSGPLLKSHYLSELEKFVNEYHYGLHYNLRSMKPYRLSSDGTVRHIGMFYNTKTGKIKIAF